MSSMYDELSDHDRETLAAGFCCDCGYRGFVLGPKGGHSMNIECGSVHCRARFNVARDFVHGYMVFAQRIPSPREGGADWGFPATREPPPDTDRKKGK